MTLIKYGLAAGIGYYLGQPEGRRQLVRLRQQVVELIRRPQVKQLRERGWDVAGERALAAKNFASTKLVGKRKAAGNPEASERDNRVDDDAAEAAATARHLGIRGLGRRRPRPNPAAPTTVQTNTPDPPASGAGLGGRTQDSQAPIREVSGTPLVAPHERA